MRKSFRACCLIALGILLGVVFARRNSQKEPVISSKLVNVVLTTTNISAETDFYENVLGFKSFYHDKTSCFLKTGAVNLVLVLTKDKSKASRNLCLDVATKDLTASYDSLTTAGIKVDKADPNILKFSDPDGNLIEDVHG